VSFEKSFNMSLKETMAIDRKPPAIFADTAAKAGFKRVRALCLSYKSEGKVKLTVHGFLCEEWVDRTALLRLRDSV
jgi:hypothetical protein